MQQVMTITALNEYIRGKMDADSLLNAVAVKGSVFPSFISCGEELAGEKRKATASSPPGTKIPRLCSA